MPSRGTFKPYCVRGHLRTLETVNKDGACKKCMASKDALKYPKRKLYDRLRPKGWTIERFNAVLTQQEHCCAICGLKLGITKPYQNGATADHKHVIPPQPRGVLCGLCNRGIGHFKDDPDMLDRAAAYLRKWEGSNDTPSTDGK